MLICAGPALVFRTVPVYQIDITFKNGIATPGQVCVIENVQLKKQKKQNSTWPVLEAHLFFVLSKICNLFRVYHFDEIPEVNAPAVLCQERRASRSAVKLWCRAIGREVLGKM